MIDILLWVLGCYALGALAVHAAFRSARKKPCHEVEHYILIAGNEQQQIEWYIRSLARRSRESGQEIRVTLIDRCSEDETMQIARCFARHGMPIQIMSPAWLEEAPNAGQTGSEGKNDQSGVKQGSPLMEWMRLQERVRSQNHNQNQTHNQTQNQNEVQSPIIWRLRSAGLLTSAEHAVVVDLQEPLDIQKLPL